MCLCVVMFGRPELFNDCLVALCPLGSFTGLYIQTVISSTFRFNRQIMSEVKFASELRL